MLVVMKIGVCFVLLLCVGMVQAQRKLPAESKEQKKIEKQAVKKNRNKEHPETELRWNPRKLPNKSRGLPEISAWHTGTAGIIAPDAAEISLFNSTRIGFSKKTELLFKIAEEPILPNFGLKHLWWNSRHLALATEHTLYYTYPGLKLLQNTGFKDLVPDSVKIGQGLAMRHELLMSWLMNPQTEGCPSPASERILTLRLGTEFYIGFNKTELKPFDYIHTLYHTQLLKKKVLYWGGLQFNSYLGNRFHYSVNSLFYNVDFRKNHAIEANLRMTYYVARRFGISISGKGAYISFDGNTKLTGLPLLDLTYLVNPGRTTIKHGLFKNRKRK